MAILLVQKGGVQTTGAGTPVTVNWSPGGSSTAGNLIAVMVSSYATATGTYTVTDQAGGNAFAQATDYAWDATWGVKSAVWYLANCPAGITGVQVASAAAGFQPTIGIAEFSGCATATPLGPTITASGNSTAANSGNVTPVDAGSLIWGGGPNGGYAAGSQTNTVGSGFTADYNAASGTVGICTIAEHLVQATAAAIAATFTLSSANIWWAHAAVFKPAAGGGGPVFVTLSPTSATTRPRLTPTVMIPSS